GQAQGRADAAGSGDQRPEADRELPAAAHRLRQGARRAPDRPQGARGAAQGSAEEDAGRTAQARRGAAEEAAAADQIINSHASCPAWGRASTPPGRSARGHALKDQQTKTWMAGTSPAMTGENQLSCTCRGR